jgi:hypothetical protein
LRSLLAPTEVPSSLYGPSVRISAAVQLMSRASLGCMSELRNIEDRQSDAIELLGRNGDGWIATASPTGRPHLIAVSTWWDGTHLVIATVGSSRTARNLDATRRARLALGSTDDAVLVDAEVVDSVAVNGADPDLRGGFIAAAGWDPGDEGSSWRFFSLLPARMQAFRGYGELQGREVMRNGRWLETE